MKLARSQLAHRHPRDFTFYVADPISSIPDLWQQEAVRALQQVKDVVVQAPTGSGKTYINLDQRRMTNEE